MKYRQNIPSQDFEQALYLDKNQVTKIKKAIQKAYDSIPERDFNIDEVNAFVAPYIKTPEEAFFAATTIMSDILGAAMKMGVKPTL